MGRRAGPVAASRRTTPGSSTRDRRDVHHRAVTEAQHRRVEAAEDVQEVVGIIGCELDRGPLRGLQHHLGHRHIEMLALTGAAALQQRGEDAHCRVRPRVEIRVRDRLLTRLGTQLAGTELHQPQLGVQHGCVGAPPCHRAVLAEAGDRAVHHRGVAPPHRLVAETEAVEHARAEVSRGRRRRRRPDRARALGPRRHGDRRRHIVSRSSAARSTQARRPRVVARTCEIAFGWLDLDHVGAEVGERLPARRP